MVVMVSCCLHQQLPFLIYEKSLPWKHGCDGMVLPLFMFLQKQAAVAVVVAVVIVAVVVAVAIVVLVLVLGLGLVILVVCWLLLRRHARTLVKKVPCGQPYVEKYSKNNKDDDNDHNNDDNNDITAISEKL